MSADANREIVRRWIEEGWNRGNVDIADDLYSPEFTAEPMREGELRTEGIQAVKDYVLHLRAAFPDLHFTVRYLVAEGDIVVGAFQIEGTHSGTLFGIPATGKKVSFTAVDVWRFQEGKIRERPLAVADFLRSLQQMGVVPHFG